MPVIFLLVPDPLEFYRVSASSEPWCSVPIPEPPGSLNFPFLCGVCVGVGVLTQMFMASAASECRGAFLSPAELQAALLALARMRRITKIPVISIMNSLHLVF